MSAAITKPIFVLNGPNLNLLGQRETGTYGSKTLSDVEAECRTFADGQSVSIDFRQSNHEGVLVDWMQEAHSGSSGIIINAGAYTHTSIALRDAISGIDPPVLELHVSNIHARESFRHTSMIVSACIGQICGLGTNGYPLAIQAMIDYLKTQ